MNPWTIVDELRRRNRELRQVVACLALALVIMFLVLILAWPR